jgi:hypothetical protein
MINLVCSKNFKNIPPLSRMIKKRKDKKEKKKNLGIRMWTGFKPSSFSHQYLGNEDKNVLARTLETRHL